MAAQADCIFCRIVRGQIPCYRLFEDEQVLSFLDVGPLSRGHALVIPKQHYATLDEMSAELAGVCMATVARVGPAVMAAIGKAGGPWNVLQNNGTVAGQVIGHVHFHIIPRSENDGLGYRWNPGSLDADNAKQLAAAIARTL